jgi:hypothetical protein
VTHNRANKARLGEYGPVFIIEMCTQANPRWRRRGREHHPTFEAAQAKKDRIEENSDKSRKRLFRVATYYRDPFHTEECGNFMP